MSGAAITVSGLGKRYRLGATARYGSLRESLAALARGAWRGGRPGEEFWALREISFSIAPGEVVGVVGRNGSGKSTLLKLLARITGPSTGEARIRGRVGSLLEVGTGFHPELTGRENIYLGGAVLGMRRADITRRFAEIVAFAEVERFIDTPVKQYSSGMYMRLAFAVAAHLDTEILLIDEVLAVGDAEFQKRCLGRMGELAGQGRTVLFVSHQLGAVRSLCTRALLLAGGALAAVGTPDEIIQTYLEGGTTMSRWSRPDGRLDNPWFAPQALRIVDAHGVAVAMPCANDQDLWLAIDAEIQQLNRALTVGYSLSTVDGQLLYWSYQTDRSERAWPELRTGRLTLLGRIPSRFLNQGRYRLALLGGLHFQEWLFPPDGQASVVLDIARGLSDSPLWTEARPGTLAPVLEWKVAP